MSIFQKFYFFIVCCGNLSLVNKNDVIDFYFQSLCCKTQCRHQCCCVFFILYRRFWNFAKKKKNSLQLRIMIHIYTVYSLYATITVNNSRRARVSSNSVLFSVGGSFRNILQIRKNRTFLSILVVVWF